jgi:hypothetical protein
MTNPLFRRAKITRTNPERNPARAVTHYSQTRMRVFAARAVISSPLSSTLMQLLSSPLTGARGLRKLSLQTLASRLTGA